jgi:hypothetical protein
LLRYVFGFDLDGRLSVDDECPLPLRLGDV